MSLHIKFWHPFAIFLQVIQSKYMHAHGVRHDDIKPENILVSGHKSFIIGRLTIYIVSVQNSVHTINDFIHLRLDFNRSSKMSNDSGACTVDYAARVSHFKKPRVAKSDWESFLYSMCYVLRVPLGWFHPQIRNLVQQEKEIYCGSFKTQTDKIRVNIYFSFAYHFYLIIHYFLERQQSTISYRMDQ